ncbi:MAG: hypothetical protein ABI760_22560 [Ferruginibacter sp.]
MNTNQKSSSPGGMISLVLILINAVILKHAFTLNEKWYWALIVTIPLLIASGIYNKKSRKVNNSGLNIFSSAKL